eukprot:CAMPEP_0172711948 /NCGR_PEP_ID=MMETSP1074-20121228/60795_1 /TAXON_ID=2916 /ORGANISM="Ceratium fusus, Strain PA161109" /LENGTH=208 /DNA_ID=CAMNT_0013535805 /DNA_START=179 /DNA_END=806 /DNA_ORIENTATION=-
MSLPHPPAAPFFVFCSWLPTALTAWGPCGTAASNFRASSSALSTVVLDGPRIDITLLRPTWLTSPVSISISAFQVSSRPVLGFFSTLALPNSGGSPSAGNGTAALVPPMGRGGDALPLDDDLLDFVFGETASSKKIFHNYDQLAVAAFGHGTPNVSMEGLCAVAGCNPYPSVAVNIAGMKTVSFETGGCPEIGSARIHCTRWALSHTH